MVNTNHSAFNFCRNRVSLNNGFTLVELLTASVIATIVGGSALYVLNDINNSSSQSSNRRNLSSSLDSTLRIITNEVKQSRKIFPSKELIRKDMGVTGGSLFGGGNANACTSIIPDNEFLFGLKLPDQVLFKGDYYKDLNKSDYKSKRIKKFVNSDCNYIFYGLSKNTLSNSPVSGPYSLYRIGFDQNSEGYYNPNSVSKSILNASISDVISSSNIQPNRCFTDYYSIIKHGVQICIDKVSQRTINLSLVSKNSNYGNTFSFTRSSSASTSISQGGTIFGDTAPNLLCSNAVFLLDISGSMSAYMASRNPRIKRIELARVEIINVVRDCPEDSKINVLTFNGGSRGSSFKPQLVKVNDSIRAQLKTWLNRPEQQPGGGTNPWPQMEKPFKKSDVFNVHIIGDGIIYKWGSFMGTYGETSIIFKSKNDARDPSLNVYSYSLDNDFCTGNNQWKSNSYIDPRWMGRIADSCKVVK